MKACDLTRINACVIGAVAPTQTTATTPARQKRITLHYIGVNPGLWSVMTSPTWQRSDSLVTTDWQHVAASLAARSAAAVATAAQTAE